MRELPIAVDPRAKAHPRTARAFGVALSISIALASVWSALAFEPGNGAVGLIVFGAILAVGCCSAAALWLFRLAVGATRVWAALTWFCAALLSLFILDFFSVATRLGG